MLDQLKPHPGSRRNRRRVGRGMASGSGRTCGRGQKGAGARSGSKRRSYYEGGQMPLARRLPKRGFTNLFRRETQVVNVAALGRFEAGAEVDARALAEAGLVPNASRPVKLLGEGTIEIPLKVRVDAVSAGARAKIEAAGGSVERVEGRAPEEADQP